MIWKTIPPRAKGKKRARVCGLHIAGKFAPQNWITWHQLLFCLWSAPNVCLFHSCLHLKTSLLWKIPKFSLLLFLTWRGHYSIIEDYLYWKWIFKVWFWYLDFQHDFQQNIWDLEVADQMWKYSRVKYERILRIWVLMWIFGVGYSGSQLHSWQNFQEQMLILLQMNIWAFEDIIFDVNFWGWISWPWR